MSTAQENIKEIVEGIRFELLQATAGAVHVKIEGKKKVRMRG